MIKQEIILRVTQYQEIYTLIRKLQDALIVVIRQLIQKIIEKSTMDVQMIVNQDKVDVIQLLKMSSIQQQL